MHLAGFAPAFTLSLCDSERSRKPPVPIASVVSGKFKKQNADSETNTRKVKSEKKTWGKWLKCKIEERKQEKANLRGLRDDDWYYQHSWFEKEYFIHKLKRKIMNFTYKLYKNSLETYFFEMIFYVNQLPDGELEKFNYDVCSTHLGNLKCYLPIIFKVNHISQAQHLASLITKQLFTNNCALITNYGVDVRMLTPKEEKLKLDELELRFRIPEKQKGVLEITTNSINILKSTDPNPRIDELSVKIIDVCKLDWPFNNRFVIRLEKHSTEE